MKTTLAFAALAATAALSLALGSAERSAVDHLPPTVVRYVNMNKIFETAERFKEEREAMTKAWEKWRSELVGLD